LPPFPPLNPALATSMKNIRHFIATNFRHLLHSYFYELGPQRKQSKRLKSQHTLQCTLQHQQKARGALLCNQWVLVYCSFLKPTDFEKFSDLTLARLQSTAYLPKIERFRLFKHFILCCSGTDTVNS